MVAATTCRAHRTARGWNQLKLAVVADVCWTVITKCESAKPLDEIDNTQLRTLRKVARALGLSVVELVPGLGEREGEKPEQFQPLDTIPPDEV